MAAAQTVDGAGRTGRGQQTFKMCIHLLLELGGSSCVRAARCEPAGSLDSAGDIIEKKTVKREKKKKSKQGQRQEGTHYRRTGEQGKKNENEKSVKVKAGFSNKYEMLLYGSNKDRFENGTRKSSLY